MKRVLLFVSALLPAFPITAQEHMHHQHDVPVQASKDGTEPKPGDYHSPGLPPEPGKEIRKYAEDEPGKPQENFGMVAMHENQPFFQFISDRLEYRSDGKEQRVLWDFDAWYGSDYNKLYLESEGEHSTDGKLESAQLEMFWNHTIASFWDSQLGLRHDFQPGDSRSFLAVGVQGMAPYLIEIDATAYLSEDGDPSAVFEAETDFYLTQRLVLQPRMETEIAFSDVPEYEIGAGFTSLETGLRLRYEFSRKFAPYLGVEWERSLGETANLRRAGGEDVNQTFFIAGVKFWF